MYIVIKLTTLLLFFLIPFSSQAQNPIKPHVLISSDIGGTDPDDNQSMVHLMMYSDLFQLEGLVSSPSFGNGSKEEILRMIDLYAKDYTRLKRQNDKLMPPDDLRKLCKQGQRLFRAYRRFWMDRTTGTKGEWPTSLGISMGHTWGCGTGTARCARYCFEDPCLLDWWTKQEMGC